MASRSALHVAPNQKVVTIHKEPDSERVYVKNDLEAMQNAIRRMNGKKASGYILWSILAGNKSGYQMPISNKAFNEMYGIGKDCFDSGIKFLIEQGFMIRNQGNQYDFFEYPEEHKAKSGESQLLKSGKTPQPKVVKPHYEKWGKPTFKSGETPQDNNKRNRNKDNTTTTRGTGSCGGCSDDSGKEIGNQEELDAILKAAADAGFPKNERTTRKIIDLYSQYGLDRTMAGIDACVDQGKQSPSYLRGCLNRMEKGIGKHFSFEDLLKPEESESEKAPDPEYEVIEKDGYLFFDEKKEKNV